MRAPEPFVAAPSLWADEIYGSDLKPPVALGLENSPTTASGIYTNKLVDYTNNLRLFLDGYTIERPTAQVRSDVEVIQLPGPAAQVNDSAYSAHFVDLDPASSGWSFIVPNIDTWIMHPTCRVLRDGAELGSRYGLRRRASHLCPLGLLARSLGSTEGRKRGRLSERVNVRSGNIALNLVGWDPRLPVGAGSRDLLRGAVLEVRSRALRTDLDQQSPTGRA